MLNENEMSALLSWKRARYVLRRHDVYILYRAEKQMMNCSHCSRIIRTKRTSTRKQTATRTPYVQVRCRPITFVPQRQGCQLCIVRFSLVRHVLYAIFIIMQKLVCCWALFVRYFINAILYHMFIADHAHLSNAKMIREDDERLMSRESAYTKRCGNNEESPTREMSRAKRRKSSLWKRTRRETRRTYT